MTWSAWIDGDEVAYETNWRIHNQAVWDLNAGGAQYSTIGTFGAPPPPGGTLPVSWPDHRAYLDAALADGRNGVTRGDSFYNGVGMDIGTQERWLWSGAAVTYQEWGETFRASQAAATYDGADHSSDVTPDSASYFTAHGITDYGTDPTTGDAIQVEASSSTLLGWNDWIIEMRVTQAPGWREIRTNDDTNVTDLDTTHAVDAPINFVALTPAVSTANNTQTADGAAAFVKYADGVVLASYHPGATGATEHVTVPLSTLGTVTAFTLVGQPATLHDQGIPFSNPTIPNGSYEVSSDFQMRVSGINLDIYQHNFTDPTQRGTVPVIRYQRPRWRYWIVDDKLRTVGDHFRSVGGADVKSLQADGTWQKVRRGT